MTTTQPLVLSLFPGIGLLDMAFEAEGFCVVRGPDVLWGGDIRRFSPPAGRFDGVIGGPPCQRFSPLRNLNPAIDRFGDLIPEYERCVSEAKPEWFVMENVSAAPVARVEGYLVRDVLLNNRWLGEEQNRLRRFSFGTRDGRALHIEVAVLMSAKWKAAVTAAHGGERRTHFNKGTGGKIQRYTVKEALDAQGLPADFFEGRPLTRYGQLKALAQGVPLPMGRAIARAVKQAIADAGEAGMKKTTPTMADARTLECTDECARFACEACGHQHADISLGNICIGCPCERRAPDVRHAFMGRLPHPSAVAQQQKGRSTRTIVLIPGPDDLLPSKRVYWDNFVKRAADAMAREGLDARIVVAGPVKDSP